LLFEKFLFNFGRKKEAGWPNSRKNLHELQKT
jgi:hypothetical protein